jgi:dolichol-phosphate mannosyltransferase
MPASPKDDQLVKCGLPVIATNATHRRDQGSCTAANQAPELSIVIPTYNEIGNISEVIRRISYVLGEAPWEIIVVDDDSPDGTAARVKELAKTDRRIRCLRRVHRRGLAGAAIEGMLSSAAPYAVLMDGDLQHDESILPRMVELLRGGELDLVIGSRYANGGAAETGFSTLRAWISRWSGKIARFVLKTQVKDIMSGFFAIRRDYFDVIAPRLETSGFKILANILFSTPVPLRTAEIGYTFRGRGTGESKLDLRVAIDFVGLLSNKLSRGMIPVRFILFGLVGGSGVIIHLLVLRSTMLAAPEMKFFGAQTCATLVAMTSNFFINNLITYRDRRLKSPLIILRRILLFYGICTVGVIANVTIAFQIFERTDIWWLAGISGLVISSVWNYTLSSLFVWSQWE